MTKLEQLLKIHETEDTLSEFINLNDKLPRWLAAVRGGKNTSCHDNNSCSGNITCSNNDVCNDNSVCENQM